MKNRYELKETTLLQLENDELRARIKELKQKLQDYENEMRKMQQDKGIVAILQESNSKEQENKNLH